MDNDSNLVDHPSQSTLLDSAKSNLRSLPWVSFLAVVFAISAQRLLEPAERKVEISFLLYLTAVVLVGWASMKNGWHLPALPGHRSGSDPLSVRSFSILLSIPFVLAAFWAFGSGEFTFTNTALWLLALGLLVHGLSLKNAPKPQIADERGRIINSIWIMIMVAVFGLAIFFRFNQVDSLPAQPFSDHAEKMLDLYDISQGQQKIFFERNTGREAFQMYWTLLTAKLFGTGISFLSLKLGTALLGILTLPFIYLLGKEYGNPRAGLFALFLFGIAYWPNVISRIGLRFPLYPFFLAPTFLFLTRGLRTRSRNDFILCGLFLGLGLHGYSPFRIVPFLVVVAFALYLMHVQSIGTRCQAFWWFAIISVVSLYVFLPLLRYALDHYDTFSLRTLSRLGNVETNLPDSMGAVFFSNLLKGLLMFNWDDGDIWVNSLPHRPALDVVTGALFVLGVVLLCMRYLRHREWRDLLLLSSIPLLLMPSVLSLAFPVENPALNRAGGAAVSAILVSALALDGLVTGLSAGRKRPFLAYGVTGMLLAASAFQNYDLVFRQFNESYLRGVWNTSEMGEVIREFGDRYGQTDTAWIVPYPQWVDTRLPAMWSGILDRDFALWPEQFADTTGLPAPKLFIFKPEDLETENALRVLYPDAELSRYTLLTPGKDFMVLFVEE
jgi:hypothetical protein